MPLPTLRDVHVDTPLTNMSLAIVQRPDAFIASQVFPTMPVDKASDKYYIFDPADFHRDGAGVRAPATESRGGGFRLSTDTYSCDVTAYHMDVAMQTLANEDAAVNLRQSATQFVTHKMLLSKEIDFAASYFTTGVWDTDITGVASSPSATEAIYWSDQTNGDPIGDIRSALTAVQSETGYRPNTMVVNQEVYDALEDHPDIVDRIKYSGGVGPNSPARVSQVTMAQLFGLDRIMVMGAIKNTAGEALTASTSFVGGKNALLTYTPPSPGLFTAAAGYTFSWRGYLNQSNDFGLAITRFDMPELKAERIEGELAYQHKVVGSSLGYFFSGIVT